MSCITRPPELRNEGDWARPGHAPHAFDYLYPGRDFPVAGHWHLQPPESSPVPPAWHLHLWHHISDVPIHVLDRRMAHTGSGEVLYWFHARSLLAEYAQWIGFVSQRTVPCHVVDLIDAEAARELEHCHRWFFLPYGTAPQRFLAGYTHRDCKPAPARVRQCWNMWRFYFQTCGHTVHSHYADLRLRMHSS